MIAKPKQNDLEKDLEATVEWIGEVLEGIADEEEREFAQLPWHTHPDLRVSVTHESIERHAVEIAEGGDFKPLGRVLLTGRPIRPETQALIGRRLTGEFKAKRGPKKQSIERRLTNTPVHAAAAEVKKIAHVLRVHYPGKKKIRDLAITIAAKRAGIRRQTLVNYFGSDRRIP